jgi:hypothetical protein
MLLSSLRVARLSEAQVQSGAATCSLALSTITKNFSQ